MTDAVNYKIEKFFSQYRLSRYAKGQVLILNDETPPYVYHLVNGQVKVYDVTYRGDEIILNVFKPPAFFPMAVVLNDTPNPYIYEAETDVELYQAPREDVRAFIEANPDVTLDLLSRVYRGMDGLLGRMAHLMASSARSRLMYELVLEGRRFGTLHSDGTCILTVNEKGLGARAGLSRETVSREMNKLKAEGFLTVHPKNITINLAALEQKLSQEL